MSDARDYSSLAAQVFDICLGVRAGSSVWIDGWDHTHDLARAFESECVRRNCRSMVTVRYQDAWLRSVRQGAKGLLQTPSPQAKAALEQTDFYILMMGPASPIPWRSIPKDRRGEISVWLDTRYDKTSYARKWARIARVHRVKMLAVEATLATPARAKSRGLPYELWRDTMFEGCAVDYREMARKAKELKEVVSRAGTALVSTDSGTELRLNLGRRAVGVSDGIATEESARLGRITFLPAGVVEFSVDEHSSEGRVVYGDPVSLGDGTIEGLKLTLGGGEIRGHEAARGAGAFRSYLRGGGRAARRLSYLGFGLNPSIRQGYTQDDKALGGLTLGFGDNRALGGRNAAADQWWASLAKATVEIDGALVLEKGRYRL